ncbi:hypothetical protein EV715DRAFT_293011 [Schizophyllum commune]
MVRRTQTNHNVAHTAPSSVASSPTARATPPFNAVARYNSNLKVLRRLDPHIQSIFDQFTHVCLYHYVDGRWEKRGYEGSMFLFERDVFPPYGFCILNKEGPEDHVQYLYPEDNFDAYGNYVVIQSYPSFTDKRLADLRATHAPEELQGLFSAIWKVPDHIKNNTQKGPPTVISLWIFGTEQRESMDDVMSRLYRHVKEHARYPDECRYGPHNPPPLLVRPVNDSGSEASDSSPYLRNAEASQSMTNLVPKRPEVPRAPPSAIDGLFSNIKRGGPPPDAQSAPAGPPRAAAGPSAARAPPSNPKALTIGDILAKMGASNAGNGPHSPSINGEASPMSGKSLMDTFFPNANLEAGPSTSAPATTVPPASSEPQGAANGNSARVLTNDVISTLLRGGRMPSAAAAWERRSESRSSSSHSNEGDDEESDDVNDNAQLSFDDGYEYSESSTVLDEMEADGEEVVYAADIRINGHSAPHSEDDDEPEADRHANNSRTRNGRRIQGDMTPRPPLMPTPPPEMAPAMSSESNATIRAQSLVPFQDDSELWPYDPPAEGEAPDDGDDIIELDFSETAALSDPDALYAKKHPSSANGNATDASFSGNGTSWGGKKSRRERARARDRAEREHIERTWEMPPSASVPAPEAPPKATTNGKGKARAEAGEESGNGKVNTNVLKDAILAQAQGRLPARLMEQKEFTTEVLSLFYTDKEFVDDLYNDYYARQGHSN